MDKQEGTKQTGFRLPPETVNQLDWMVEEGFVRNRTEAVILAVDRFQNQKRNDQYWESFLSMLLDSIEKNPEDLDIYRALLDGKAVITRTINGDEEEIFIETPKRKVHIKRKPGEPQSSTVVEGGGYDSYFEYLKQNSLSKTKD